MSTKVSFEYGRGFCLDEVSYTKNSLLALIKKAPQVYDCITKNLADNGLTEETADLEDIADAYEYDGTRFAGIIACCINEIIGHEYFAYSCSNYDGSEYVMFVQTYPWYMSEWEKNLTEEKVDEIFRTYLDILSVTRPPIDYIECERCC